MQHYEKLGRLGEGMFGVVFKGKHKDTGEHVALKRIRLGNNRAREGVTFTALREIKYLRTMNHAHVVRMTDVFQHKGALVLAFELMCGDLEDVIKDKRYPLPLGDIKSYMQQSLRGLAYLHSQWILHRDIKPNNLLFDGRGHVKLGDFGLARSFGSPSRELTHQVVTRWYRAPELLYGARFYGPGVDIWAMGCVFAELLLRNPFLPGDSDLDQLGKMFHALGSPTEKEWPGMTSLPDYMPFSPCQATPLELIFRAASSDALDLMRQMLLFNPSSRCSAQQALDHAYFQPSSLPLATPLPDLSVHALIQSRKEAAAAKTAKTAPPPESSSTRRRSGKGAAAAEGASPVRKKLKL